MILKELKKGEYFTIKPIETPNDCQVFIKGDYDRETKTYICVKCSDVFGTGRAFKANKLIYTDFIY